MSLGPLELVVLRFSGTDFRGEVLGEIQKVVDAGVIHVVDILLAVRFGDEPVRVLEMIELEDEVMHRFEPVVADVTRLLTDDDAIHLSAGLGPDSAVAVLLFEHTWVTGIADAIERAGGATVMVERIPRSVVEELVSGAQ
jgi:hypothetical protein